MDSLNKTIGLFYSKVRLRLRPSVYAYVCPSVYAYLPSQWLYGY